MVPVVAPCAAQLVGVQLEHALTEVPPTPHGKSCTGMGVGLSLVVPSPSSKSLSSPQHVTPPPVSAAQVCVVPAESHATLERPATATGVERLVVVPSPSWP